MIRVFAIAMLALAALVVVSRNLPERPEQEVEETAVPSSSPVDLFVRYEGAWEGTFKVYRPDGTLVRSLQVRQEYGPPREGEQAVIIRDLFPDGTTRITTGSNRLLSSGSLECVLRDEEGNVRVLEGRRDGSTVTWHRADPETGTTESYRERLIPAEGGVLYLVDGVGQYGHGGALLLYEGRYRKVEGPVT